MPKKKKKHIVASIVIFAVLASTINIILSNFSLSVKKYTYGSDLRIVYISDLHNRKIGEKLPEKIAALNPDIICLGGDFIDDDNTTEQNENFLSLCSALLKIAPVYYSYGNHDLYYLEDYGFSITEKMKSAGIVILEEEFVDLTVNGKDIRLGGMFNYAFNQTYMPREDWYETSTPQFLMDFCETDRTKILLCHRPESFIYDNATSLWDIDYILCGHTHGGLWRMPFLGGVFAPEQGFNPEYDKGEFIFGDKKMIISGGLAGHKNIPRLNNSPEITVIDL